MVRWGRQANDGHTFGWPSKLPELDTLRCPIERYWGKRFSVFKLARSVPVAGEMEFPRVTGRVKHTTIGSGWRLYCSLRISSISNFKTPCGTSISTRSPTFLSTKPWANGLVMRIFPLS